MEVENTAILDIGQKRQFSTFWLSGLLFGVDILDVKEITPEVTLTPIFHASEEVRGYVNIRGHIHLVLDLRLLLGFERGEITPESRIVLFKPTVGESFGVLVDRINDVVEVEKDRIEIQSIDPTSIDTNELQKCRNELSTGICQLNEQLLVILDAKKLLTASGDTISYP